MAYTIAQFITQAQARGGIIISSGQTHADVLINIGGTTITISDSTRLDLGTLFSARQVLELVIAS